jgi:hypothetical protein
MEFEARSETVEEILLEDKLSSIEKGTHEPLVAGSNPAAATFLTFIEKY